MRLGQWKAQSEFNGVAGFHLNALYAPWANLSLPKLAEKFLNATSQGGRPALLRAFTNTILGECWHEEYQKIDTTGLADRVEKYPAQDGVVLVPAGVVLITAGVDCQADRLEISRIGWGRGEECWVLDHLIVPGTGPDAWNQLWEIITEPLRTENGGEAFVRATCVDTGYNTQEAYDFCRPRYRYPLPDGRRGMVFAIKGQSGSGDIWPRKPMRSTGSKTPLFGIRVAPAKEVLMSRLQKIASPGRGYIHFPDSLPEDYFRQLTAERVVSKYDARGFATRVWELKGEGKRNETLDCWVYSYAAVAAIEAGGWVLDREAERLDALMEPSAETDIKTGGSPPTGPTSDSPFSGSATSPRGTAVTPGRRRVSRSTYLGR